MYCFTLHELEYDKVKVKQRMCRKKYVNHVSLCTCAYLSKHAQKIEFSLRLSNLRRVFKFLYKSAYFRETRSHISISRNFGRVF